MVAGLARMPINSGVFLIRASAWSRDFLLRTYEQTQFVTNGVLWDGVGEQEAMIALLRAEPRDLQRIKYVTGLQNHPRFYRDDDLFVHFYGNHARHRISLIESAAVIARWDRAVRAGAALPPDRMRFHWCCIQNKHEGSTVVKGDLSHYLYSPDDIAAAPRSE